ncbi:RidA family protein [Amycolatopsis antarctica]|uniref:RidA family protein n=1 Tax=Amycolatopsis antarctica TaxID=1854586 RepID=UPI0013FDA06D|nr:RidA family protein [Amycolatopsis antarctica]
MIERIHPPEFAQPAVPLSHGVRAGGFLFVSGQTATDDEGGIYVGDFEREVRGALDNVEAVLRAGGASVEQVVRVGAYLSNATLFAPFNAIYAQRFGAAPPARTTVVVDFGHANVRVELDAVAFLG